MTQYTDESEAQLSDLTWNGEHERAIALAHERYEEEPHSGLFPYAVALYSARKEIDVVEAFKGLVEPLIVRITESFDEGDVDGLDVIATHLWWVQRTRGFHLIPQIKARLAAIKAARLGLELTEDYLSGEHTRALLALSYAQMGVDQPRKWLKEAEELAPHIRDPNQKARVYRKLGYVQLTRLNLRGGIRNLVRSERVPGIAADVRAKNPLRRLLRLVTFR